MVRRDGICINAVNIHWLLSINYRVFNEQDSVCGVGGFWSIQWIILPKVYTLHPRKLILLIWRNVSSLIEETSLGFRGFLGLCFMVVEPNA